MSLDEDKRIYAALALPNEAIANGGVEVLRAGIIDDEVFVSARRAFQDHAQWGEVLAAVAQRIATLTSAEDTEFTEAEILTDIEEAFLAALGAPVVPPVMKAAKKKAKAGPQAKRKSKAKPNQAKVKSAKTKARVARKPALTKPRARKAAANKRAKR